LLIDMQITLIRTSKVGKTSLIMSLVSEEFPDEVQSFIEMTQVQKEQFKSI
uniref:Uncharacterized protein n=1 Tax=Sinocyclocheilus grahami TaxID=75366 RepID=A0A672K5T9_SINGR